MSRQDGAKPDGDLQRTRLSASLRENLKRRKSQQRLRAQATAAARADDEAPAAADAKR